MPSTSHFFFIAFCHFLSILDVKYNTLYFAFCKACARGFPSTPFTKGALILNKVACASCGAFPHWLSPPPPRAVQTLWNSMSVGGDSVPHPSNRSMVATPLFCKQKSKPLTACFRVWYLAITDGTKCPEGVQSARADTRVLGSVAP